ncbi:MAG: MmgE/PrpD family protein [Hyphomicrobiales bacterium]|nr:MAG: MmgE/PrpD family protein [Hyphomicrobiales bacterium]
MPIGNTSEKDGFFALKQGSSTALQLGSYVAGLDAKSFTWATTDAVHRCVLDAISSAAAALAQPGARAAQQAAPLLFGPGDSVLWFTGRTASTGGAMLANSASTAALDLDDGFRIARGHPGAAVLPTALALAQGSSSVTVEDFMAAVVAGYEIGVRFASARPAYAPSGAWSGFAVVATAGRLLRLEPDVIAQALAIVVQTAPALPALAGIAGSDVKEGIPAGVAAGWAAVQLAMAGFSGPVTVLEDPRLFDGPTLLGGLDGEPLIKGTYFKPFGCCRHIHAPLEGLLFLQAQHRLDGRDIVDVEVFTYQATFNLTNKSHPETLVEAQYSVPYCLALCVLHGPDALVPLDAEHLRDPKIGELAQRIEVTHDTAIEPLFPARSPARVTVTLRGGDRLESPLMDPRGDPERPMSWADLEAKLRISSRSTLHPTHQQSVIDGVAAFQNGDLRPLLDALAVDGAKR